MEAGIPPTSAYKRSGINKINKENYEYKREIIKQLKQSGRKEK